jgi:hypothetical protein
MLVEKATFQRMGSGGKGGTENRWDVSGAGQSAPPDISYISTINPSREFAADRRSDDRFVPGDTV